MTNYEPHPAASIFPMLEGDELQQLADDIRAHGQREAIILLDDQILDGRNRLAACHLAGVTPRFAELAECGDPIAYVISANIHRRHLSASQRAMLAATLREMYDEQAKERQRQGGKEGGRGRPKKVVAKVPQPIEPKKSRDQAGKAVGVAGKLVDAATKVREQGAPEVAQAVEAGKLSVGKAVKLAELPVESQPAALADVLAGDPVDQAVNRAKAMTAELTIAAVSSEQRAAEFMAEWNREVEAYARKVTALLKDAPEGAWLIERMSVVKQQLDSAAGTIRMAKCKHVCPRCAGDGCKICHETGIVTKQRYDSHVER